MECVAIKRCTVSKFDRMTSFAQLGIFFLFFFNSSSNLYALAAAQRHTKKAYYSKGLPLFIHACMQKNKVTSFDSMHMHAHVYPEQLGGGGCISAKMDAALTSTGSQRRKHLLSRVFLSDHFSNEMNGPAMRGVEENG